MKPNSVDTIYYHGVIAAVDKDFSLAQAMAVSGDRICAIGSDREVLALRSEDTACVDLRGAFVVPGLQDAHVHAADYIHNLSHVPCAECRDIPELQEQLRHWAGEHPDLWILGNGLSQQVMDEGLDRIHLDAVVKDRPVILVMWHGHGCIANSAALERSGITVSTPDPPGGVIERDASGAPTGVLQEASALQLAYRGMPPYSAEEISEKLLRMQRFMNSMGYTAYTESTVGTANNGREGGAAGMACIRAYERLLEEKQLTCRVSVGFYSGRDGIQSPEILREDLAAGLVPKSPDEDWLSFHMLKFFCDGVEVAHTAWMKEDYADLPGCRGSSCFGGGEMSDEEQAAVLRETLKAAHDAGYQIGIHCIGNRAVHEAAEAIAAIQRENPRPDARHCIIHGDTLADREDLETCGKLGLVISSQPNLASDMYEKESECGDMEAELMELPGADKVLLSDEMRQDYTVIYNELWGRFNIIKNGVTLSRQFNEAFFWPTITVNAGEKQIQPKNQELLINSSDVEIARTAKVFSDLYQLTKNGTTEELLMDFSNANSSIVKDYYDCFVKIEAPDSFYEKINTFVEALE